MIKYITAAESPYFLNLKDDQTQQLPLQDVYVSCDSTNGPISILLPETQDFPVQNLRVFIIDAAGVANIHAITVSTSGTNLINGLSNYTISTRYGFARIGIGSPDLFTATSASAGGGGGLTLTLITYTDLVAMAGAANLTVGAFYLITDFQMFTYIQFSGGGLGSEEIYAGAIEPMIIQAASVSGLSGSIMSTVYPKDTITYSLSFRDRDYDAVAGQSTGVITSREDNQLKIKRDFDWRNVIFRRWETINGSQIYDSITNTGFSYTDYPPFPIAANTCFDCYIGSPLSLGGFFGIPYQLDNTIGKDTTAFMTIVYAYGNNVDKNFDSNGYIEFFVNNKISRDVVNNTGTNAYINNTVSQIDSNNCNAITGNIGDDFEITNNGVTGSITDNNFAGVGRISRNVCAGINSNISAIGCTIRENVGQEINENADISNIEANNVAYINSNDGNGVDSFVIESNIGNTIKDNSNISAITGVSIANNSIGAIEQCNLLGKSIVGCTGNYLRVDLGQSDGDFTKNSFCRIDNVAFLGIGGPATGIQNNSFQANLVGGFITPTPEMASTTPSQTVWDTAKGNCALEINNAVFTTTPI